MSDGLLMMLAMFGVIYCFVLYPEKKRKKNAQIMRDHLMKGDIAVTIGGVTGKVVATTEDKFTIETGEDRVRIEFDKWALSTVIDPNAPAKPEKKAGKKAEKAEAKAVEETDAAEK